MGIAEAGVNVPPVCGIHSSVLKDFTLDAGTGLNVIPVCVLLIKF